MSKEDPPIQTVCRNSIELKECKKPRHLVRSAMTQAAKPENHLNPQL